MNNIGSLGVRQARMARVGGDRYGVCMLCHPGATGKAQRKELAVRLYKLPNGVALCLEHVNAVTQPTPGQMASPGALKRAVRRAEKRRIRAENLAKRAQMKEAIAAGMPPADAASAWSAHQAKQRRAA